MTLYVEIYRLFTILSKQTMPHYLKCIISQDAINNSLVSNIWLGIAFGCLGSTSWSVSINNPDPDSVGKPTGPDGILLIVLIAGILGLSSSRCIKCYSLYIIICCRESFQECLPCPCRQPYCLCELARGLMRICVNKEYKFFLKLQYLEYFVQLNVLFKHLFMKTRVVLFYSSVSLMLLLHKW